MDKLIKIEYRTDAFELGPPSETAEGFRRHSCYVARVGIMEYADGKGGVIRELVTRETLEDADAIDSMKGKPVTNDHPPVNVTPDNFKKYGVGVVAEAVEFVLDDDGNGFLKADLIVNRRDALDAIDGGKHEISPGYTVTIDMTPGTDPVWGDYDAVQTKRYYNHVAIVDRARGGSEVKLRADTYERCSVGRCDSVPSDERHDSKQGGGSMKNWLLMFASALALDTKQDGEDLADERLAADIGKEISAIKAKADKAQERSDDAIELKTKLDEAITKLGAADAELIELRKIKAAKDAEEKAAKDAADLASLELIVEHYELDAKVDAEDLPKSRQDVYVSLHIESDWNGGDDELYLYLEGIAAAARKSKEGQDPKAPKADKWDGIKPKTTGKPATTKKRDNFIAPTGKQ